MYNSLDSGITYHASNKTISIILPVYNGEKFLPLCLNSIMQQTFKDFELICVDDGSTDKSLDILKKYASHDDRIRILRQQNMHVGVARNNGLAKARGRYVIFLDADDIFAPDLLQCLYDRAETTNSDICFCAADHFDSATGRRLGRMDFTMNLSQCPKEIFSWRDKPHEFFRCTCPAPWNKLYRREFLDKTGIRFPDLHTAEDLYFFACTMAAAERISYVDKSLVNYRDNNKDSLDRNLHKYPDDFLHSLLYIRSWLLANNLYDPLVDAYRSMAAGISFRHMKICMHAMEKDKFAALLARVNAHEKELGISFTV